MNNQIGVIVEHLWNVVHQWMHQTFGYVNYDHNSVPIGPIQLLLKSCTVHQRQHNIDFHNVLLLQNGLQMASPYLRALEEFYKVKAEPIDFNGDNCARNFESVNGWIQKKTEGHVFRDQHYKIKL